VNKERRTANRNFYGQSEKSLGDTDPGLGSLQREGGNRRKTHLNTRNDKNDLACVSWAHDEKRKLDSKCKKRRERKNPSKRNPMKDPRGLIGRDTPGVLGPPPQINRSLSKGGKGVVHEKKLLTAGKDRRKKHRDKFPGSRSKAGTDLRILTQNMNRLKAEKRKSVGFDEGEKMKNFRKPDPRS